MNSDEQSRRIRSIAEIASIRQYASAEIEFVMEAIIAAGAVTVISGESGSGKSTLMTAVCGAVNRGEPFAGLATERRPVVILDRENPISAVRDRFERLGVEDGETFKVWGGWASEEAPGPNSPIIREWVEACTPKPLIVFDSLVSFHPGNENDATETRRYMQGFRRLADLGAAVVVLHHSGKAETTKEYRGSSDIKASVDVGYHLCAVGDLACLRGIRLLAFKARFLVRRELVLHYNEDRFAPDLAHHPENHHDVLQRLLVHKPGLKTAEFESLAARHRIGRQEVREFLKAGASRRVIRIDSGPHNARLHTWTGEKGNPLQ